MPASEVPTLGEVLKAERIRRNLTPRQVQLGTNIKGLDLTQIEDGTIEQPNPAILQRLARYYGLDFNQLAQLAGYIIRAVGDLGESDRRIIKNFVDKVYFGEDEVDEDDHDAR